MSAKLVSILMALTLAGTTASTTHAAGPTPTSPKPAVQQQNGRPTYSVADVPVLGRGVVQMADGTGLFVIRARPEADSHGSHGSFIWKNSEVLYNGAIHGYQVNGNTVTIEGGGGLFEENGEHHQVRFVANVVAGGPGTGSVDVAYTGRDYSERCAGTLSMGDILIGGDAKQLQAAIQAQDTVQLRDALGQLHDELTRLRETSGRAAPDQRRPAR